MHDIDDTPTSPLPSVFHSCNCSAPQTLFDGSEETPGLKGLGIIPGMVSCFDPTKVKNVKRLVSVGKPLKSGERRYPREMDSPLLLLETPLKAGKNRTMVASLCQVPVERLD